MDHIRHKCGYCGWLFSFTTNFIDHNCFKYYTEGDHINVDENYVVTIVKNNPTVVDTKENVNELLIEAVRSKRGLYDFRVPASERSILRKNALWMEVSNILRGSLSPEEAKARWKYLRDNYIKARKKVRAYVPSGSAATAANVIENKSRFQYYELMTFLNDSLQTRPTVSSLTDTKNDEVVTSLDTGNEQYEGDAVAGPSTTLSAINNSPQTPTSPYVPSRTPTPTNISSRTPTPTNISSRALDSIDVLSRTPTPTKDFPWTSTESRVPTRTRATGSKQLAQNSIDDYDEPPVVKKKKKDAATLQAALVEALREPATQAIDPLDGFLVRLGEGMRKLPYRDRARLEIKFLTILAEVEDLCFNRD